MIRSWERIAFGPAANDARHPPAGITRTTPGRDRSEPRIEGGWSLTQGARTRHLSDAPGPLTWLRELPSAGSGSLYDVARESGGPDEGAVRTLFARIASRDQVEVLRMLDQEPDLGRCPLQAGASRQDPKPYYLLPIRHYVYAGDTALHVAAAAHHRGIAESLVARGAEVRARNRRGAEPLHYAADGGSGSDDRDSVGQQDVISYVISYLIEAGADPNATDKSGVAPLHRAVRNRSSAAVSTLIENGADPLRMNKSGSTPLHLAVQNTGKSNSGSDAAKEEQHRIIVVLLRHGASPTDLDAKGKTVEAAASSEWIRDVLANH
jgi:hypothetical protein